MQMGNRASQDETISSKDILEGKFEQRVRPLTAAIRCKVETGKVKKPKELEDMIQ